MSEYVEVRVSLISAPEAPLRLAMASGGIDELTASIRSLGLLQPLVVKRAPHGYEVIAGHRRLLACRMAPLEVVPVMVVESAAEVEQSIMLAENVTRLDLSPVEEAHAIRRMAAVLGLSVRAIADKLGKSEAWVRGRLELLTWPDAALRAVAEGRAAVSALRPLLEIGDVVERDRLLECAISSGATAAVTRQWVAGVLGQPGESLDGASAAARAVLPLGEYMVHMPCFSCREVRPAVDLRVVRICDPCLDEVGTAAEALAAATPAAPAALGD